MGIFSQKTKFKVAPPTIRRVAVPIEAAKPKRDVQTRDTNSAPPTINRKDEQSIRSGNIARSSKTLSESPRPSASPPSGARGGRPVSAERLSNPGYKSDRKRKLIRGIAYRASPARDHVTFDKDSDNDDDDWEATFNEQEHRKRKRVNGDCRIDLNRRLAHPVLLETLPRKNGGIDKDADGRENMNDLDKEILRIIHAQDVASIALKCVPLLDTPEDEVLVELQYPGSWHRERYELVWGKDKIDAVKDIITTIKYIAEIYLTEEQASEFLDKATGIVRQLERASSEKIKDASMFKRALAKFNDRLLEMHNDGTLAKNLSERHDIPRHLVAFILDQVYDRTVAPNVERLRKYENGSDNVYGELLHPFITDILVDRLKMTCDQVFVDLGSGVGNVVLQAALEIGCESWGCEMMGNACDLADAQKKEFTERCRLWGIAPGEVRLQRDDFRKDTAIMGALKRADVVLVNNQAFTSELNDNLVTMFLDLKPGCKIVSLKSFVHDHKSASHNANDVGTSILDVETFTYPEGLVSWTGAAGTFCISTKKEPGL